ncbi:hypothetical protein [Maritimibacter sp. 55A14]|uniref:hypothetical protein n=1 Tax=Maritimibacter sp. 55A14 TaxID=2174844 RepID=UPI0011B289E5|nr:hypothetical protein [Maritimibacter sp. 55A14]
MKRENWTVIEGDNRPAGPPDKCFYCGEPHGSQHKDGCVIRQRTVVIRATIERVVSVPEDWEPQMIEFHRNEGSRCSDCDITEMKEMLDRMEAADLCTCNMIETTYLREASENDESACAWPQDDPHQSS